MNTVHKRIATLAVAAAAIAVILTQTARTTQPTQTQKRLPDEKMTANDLSMFLPATIETATQPDKVTHPDYPEHEHKTNPLIQTVVAVPGTIVPGSQLRAPNNTGGRSYMTFLTTRTIPPAGTHVVLVGKLEYTGTKPPSTILTDTAIITGFDSYEQAAQRVLTETAGSTR